MSWTFPFPILLLLFFFVGLCKHFAHKLAIGPIEFILIERYKTKEDEVEEDEKSQSIIMIDFTYIDLLFYR